MELTYDILYKEYCINLKSSHTIAKEYGISKTKVLYWMNKFNIPKRDITQATNNYFSKNVSKKKGKHRELDEEVKKILHEEYVINKKSTSEIAELFDTTKTTISRWLRWCDIELRKGSECAKLTALKNPRDYVKHLAKVKCEYCGKEIEVWPYRVKQSKSNIIFCNMECKGKYWSEHFIGENANNYKGKHWKETCDMRQTREYKMARIKAFHRDKYTCQLCGKTKTALNAHHIITMKENDKLAFDINNLITLCEECHVKKVNFHEKEYEKMFLDIIAKAVKTVNPLTR